MGNNEQLGRAKSLLTIQDLFKYLGLNGGFIGIIGAIASAHSIAFTLDYITLATFALLPCVVVAWPLTIGSGILIIESINKGDDNNLNDTAQIFVVTAIFIAYSMLLLFFAYKIFQFFGLPTIQGMNWKHQSREAKVISSFLGGLIVVGTFFVWRYARQSRNS
jgi:hypothetical protein